VLLKLIFQTAKKNFLILKLKKKFCLNRLAWVIRTYFDFVQIQKFSFISTSTSVQIVDEQAKFELIEPCH